MSQNTDENYDVYAEYLVNRSMSPVSAVKSDLETDAGLDSRAQEHTTESLSRDLNAVEIELIQKFLSLTLVSNAIEDTIIIVDKDGNETPDSFERRKEVLASLQAKLEDYKSLKTKVLNVCPDLDVDLRMELGDDYSTYTSGISRLIKLCGTVNSIHVVYDPSNYHYDLTDEDIGPKKFNYKEDDEESIYVAPIKTIEEDEISTDKDMLDFISGSLDTPSFIKATLIEKRFLKGKVEEFKAKSSEKSIISSVDEQTRDTLGTLSDLEKYDKFIKSKKQQRDREER